MPPRQRNPPPANVSTLVSPPSSQQQEISLTSSQTNSQPTPPPLLPVTPEVEASWELLRRKLAQSANSGNNPTIIHLPSGTRPIAFYFPLVTANGTAVPLRHLDVYPLDHPDYRHPSCFCSLLYTDPQWQYCETNLRLDRGKWVFGCAHFRCKYYLPLEPFFENSRPGPFHVRAYNFEHGPTLSQAATSVSASHSEAITRTWTGISQSPMSSLSSLTPSSSSSSLAGALTMSPLANTEDAITTTPSPFAASALTPSGDTKMNEEATDKISVAASVTAPTTPVLTRPATRGTTPAISSPFPLVIGASSAHHHQRTPASSSSDIAAVRDALAHYPSSHGVFEKRSHISISPTDTSDPVPMLGALKHYPSLVSPTASQTAHLVKRLGKRKAGQEDMLSDRSPSKTPRLSYVSPQRSQDTMSAGPSSHHGSPLRPGKVKWQSHPPSDEVVRLIRALLDGGQGVTKQQLLAIIWCCSECGKFFSAEVFMEHFCQKLEVISLTSDDSEVEIIEDE